MLKANVKEKKCLPFQRTTQKPSSDKDIQNLKNIQLGSADVWIYCEKITSDAEKTIDASAKQAVSNPSGMLSEAGPKQLGYLYDKGFDLGKVSMINCRAHTGLHSIASQISKLDEKVACHPRSLLHLDLYSLVEFHRLGKMISQFLDVVDLIFAHTQQLLISKQKRPHKLPFSGGLDTTIVNRARVILDLMAK